MLSVNQVGLAFGGTDLFKDISFQINPGERIGLVGRNGAGKSTLLSLIAGKMSVDSGKISLPNDFKIGFLTQDIPPSGDNTVWEEAASSFKEIQALESKMEEQTKQLETRTDYESPSYMDLINELSNNQETYQMLGGYTYQAEMEKVLIGLGFLSNDFHKPLTSFSGGWQMRVELAKILMQDNDVLLLDEPTNHLDIESIMWLEQFLADSPQAIILVSHDRTFLNNATTRTLEIVLGKSYDFPCPYYKYLSLREEIREKQRQAKANQEKEIKQTEELIERFRYKASKASFAQSLIKKLDKIDRIAVDEEDTRNMRFKFPPAPRSGKVVAKLVDIHKHYGPKHVLKGFDMEIVRGQKIAFVGQNGQGKSTLVKVLAENLDFTGSIDLGHQISLGYYAQNQAEVLDGSKTVLETIEDSAPEEMRSFARKMLGNFMFTGDNVGKKVSVLSGGERGRLALCQLMLNPINFLILDEPTNHLDMQAKDVLKQSLANYDGTLIVVSHDREFLSDLADITYEFKDGKIIQHLGGIEYFLDQKKMQNMRQVELGLKEKPVSKLEQKAKNKRVSKNELKKIEKNLKNAEKFEKNAQNKYENFQKELDALENILSNPIEFKKMSEDPDFYINYEQLKKKLDDSFNAWEEAVEKSSSLQKELGEIEA